MPLMGNEILVVTIFIPAGIPTATTDIESERTIDTG